MRLDLSRATLSTLAAEVLAVYEDIAEDKNIRLTSDVESGLTVVADARRLRQVLANLVDNAIKYTPSGGQVTVRARQDVGDVRIDVVDTGIGIPPHDLPRIWERLYRGDQSRAERGLGLGLSLVRAIVAAHGGTVEVVSEPGRGSTFTLRLPADRQPPTITHM
jgi:signal transduction histidine kinase